jgi:hypothetical protein
VSNTFLIAWAKSFLCTFYDAFLDDLNFVGEKIYARDTLELTDKLTDFRDSFEKQKRLNIDMRDAPKIIDEGLDAAFTFFKEYLRTFASTHNKKKKRGPKGLHLMQKFELFRVIHLSKNSNTMKPNLHSFIKSGGTLRQILKFEPAIDRFNLCSIPINYDDNNLGWFRSLKSSLLKDLVLELEFSDKNTLKESLKNLISSNHAIDWLDVYDHFGIPKTPNLRRRLKPKLFSLLFEDNQKEIFNNWKTNLI